MHDQPNDRYSPSNISSDALPPLPDLPPVEAPSAGFVVQLFVIPAVVVVVVIIVWLLFGKLAGGERDAMEYVRQLRPPLRNMRAAFELASLIQNDSKIGADPVLLGELTDVLTYELNRNDDSTLTQYVALALGAFRTLDARTEKGQEVDPIVPLARALEPKFEAAIRIAAAASLAKQAGRLNGAFDDARAVEALGVAATGEPAELRQVAAYALGFCGGEKAAQILRERVTEDEDRFVRYNAAVALARSGDHAAEKTLREMLTAADLEKVIDLASTSEKQNKIEAIELEALEALQTSSSKGSMDLARSLSPQLTELSKSGLVSVRSQALQVLQSLQAKP